MSLEEDDYGGNRRIWVGIAMDPNGRERETRGFQSELGEIWKLEEKSKTGFPRKSQGHFTHESKQRTSVLKEVAFPLPPTSLNPNRPAVAKVWNKSFIVVAVSLLTNDFQQ